MHPEQATAARRALLQRARRAIVALIHDEPGREPKDWGSGTLLRTSRGRIVVLTARHIVEARGPTQLLIEAPARPIADAVEAISLAPDQIDIAIATLRPAVEDRVTDCALPPEIVASAEDALRLPTLNPILVAGFSRQLVGEVRRLDGREVRMGLLCYWASNVGSDNRAMSIGFRTGTPTGTINFGDAVGLVKGVPLGLKKPSGLSGGAVFGVERISTSIVWSPELALRLLGVPHEYKSGRQLAISVARIGDWLAAQLA